MSNRLTFEFPIKVRKSTTRELQAGRRELLVQLAHKTHEPAREKAEERGETMIYSAEKRATRRGEILSLPRWAMFALLGQSRLSIRHSGLQAPTTKDEWQFEGSR